MTNEIKALQDELRALQEKRQTEEKVRQLKQQIKQERFNQSKTGKFFNAVGRVIGGSGQPQKKKKKGKSVSDVMANIDKAVNQFNSY